MSIDYSAKGGVLAGDLRMRVAYQALSQGTAGPYGDAVQVWGTPLNLWAEVTSLEGRELLAAKEIHADVIAKIVVRYNAAITTLGRFVYQNQNYYPASVNADPLKRRMTCLCHLRPNENVV